ncbi:hypothetical protein EGW08_017788 [Elysia chlorotica]|uniref:Uncharacterized protein n=1 Tax=Elysia chlorotica TaxID=188477 RepID=A0A433SZ59_ELYCH|nr:hypothetical protein EGW08_017788 [Elysia chlorotica]
MIGCHLETSGNKLPNDWKSYLRMRGSAWQRVIDQDINYNGYSGTSLMTNAGLSDTYGDIGKFYLNANSGTSLKNIPLELKPPSTKSAYTTWATQRNHMPKIRTAETSPRTGYSPIRNRLSTRYLPARCHLDSRLDSEAAGLTRSDHQISTGMGNKFSWRNAQSDETSVDVANTRDPSLKMKSQNRSRNATAVGLRNEKLIPGESPGLRGKQQRPNQKLSAGRSKSHTGQLIDAGWWDRPRPSSKPGSSKGASLLHETGDGVQVEANLLRRYGYQYPHSNVHDRICEADRELRGRHWTLLKPNPMKTHNSERPASISKPPDARTVELKRQLLVAREKVQQECARYNSTQEKAKRQPVERESKRKSIVPYEPQHQPNNVRITFETPHFFNKKLNAKFNQYTSGSKEFSRAITNNAFVSSPSAQNLRTTKSLSTMRTVEVPTHGSGLKKRAGSRLRRSATSAVSIRRGQSAKSSNAGRAKKSTSAAPTTTTTPGTPKSGSLSSKSHRRRRIKRKRGIRHHKDPFPNAEYLLSAPVSKTRLPGVTSLPKVKRPRSAGSLLVTQSPRYAAAIGGLKSKNKGANSSHASSVDALQREEASLEENMARTKTIDDFESLVRMHTSSPQKTPDSPSRGDNQQYKASKTSKTHGLEPWAHKETTKGSRSRGKSVTLLYSPLNKLEEARKKLRALLDSGSQSPLPINIPSLFRATANIACMPHEDEGQGGLFPSQLNSERFLWEEENYERQQQQRQYQPVDDASKQQPSVENMSRMLSDPPEDKYSGVVVKEIDPSLPAKSAGSAANVGIPDLRTSKSSPQMERFPKLKAHGANFRNTTFRLFKPARHSETTVLPKAVSRENIKADAGKDSQKESQADKKGSNLKLPNSTACDGETTGTNTIKSARDDSENNAANLPPSGDKKRKLNRKKRKSTQDKCSASGHARRGEGTARAQPKTYHQMGLAPLVRSPSSENTFHFAVDLGNMKTANKTQKHRQRRKRSGKKQSCGDICE